MRKQPSLPRHLQARLHPVATAIAARRVHSAVRGSTIKLYLTVDGADATQELSMLGFYLALAVPTAVYRLGLDAALVRQLHGALRNIHAMCLAGYRWQAALAPVIDAAMEQAQKILIRWPDTAMHFESGAETYRLAVLKHDVQPGDIAGAELYREGEAV